MKNVDVIKEFNQVIDSDEKPLFYNVESVFNNNSAIYALDENYITWKMKTGSSSQHEIIRQSNGYT